MHNKKIQDDIKFYKDDDVNFVQEVQSRDGKARCCLLRWVVVYVN
jgi:hypothetical protein